MTTWMFLLSAVLLYVHRVECNFGERAETNETVSTASPSTESGESSNMMMFIVPDNGVEVQKADLTAMISQEDDEDLTSSTPTTVTENTSNSFDMSLENDKTEERKFQDPVDEEISATHTSGWDQIGFNRFDQLRGEPTASTYFESNKIEPSNNTKENVQLELQKGFTENKYINNDYIQIWNSMPMRPTPTQDTQLFDESLKKKNLPYEHEIIEQNRLYQIEVAKAYIKQIELEQEYALRSKGLQDEYNEIPQYTRPSPITQVAALGFGSSYLPPPSTPSSVPSTQSPGLINFGVHSTSSGLRSPSIHNDYNYVSRTRDWNKSPTRLNEPYRQIDNDGSSQWRSLHNNLEGNHGQWNGPLSQSNTNHWNAFSHQWQPNFQAGHGVSPYTGPTAIPVVLPSGYLDETEEVKQARDIHLRAIVGATTPPSYWREEQLTKAWR